ncbi:MAG TPA: hypothetical protein VHA77_12295 [Xanthobacteraceae bacterium]|jgi:hypothetical protein|nr:hypothetical protein [Xanthobacteraceae bacterium]
MKKLMFGMLAVAGLGMAVPALAAPGPMKVAQVDVRIGHDRDRDWRHHHHGCRTVTIRERRGNRVIIRKVRRCG